MGGAEYPPAIDMFIESTDWVFKDALLSVPTGDLSIVIHQSGCNGLCTATSIAQYFHNDIISHKSVHFIVGKDGSVIQVVHLIDAGKHLDDGAGGNCCIESGYDPYWKPYIDKYGNLNRCTISIEHENWTTDNSDPITPAQKIASFSLVMWLCRNFNIPASRIKGHNTLDPISRAHCPGNYPMNDLAHYVATAKINYTPVFKHRGTFVAGPDGRMWAEFSYQMLLLPKEQGGLFPNGTTFGYGTNGRAWAYLPDGTQQLLWA